MPVTVLPPIGRRITGPRPPLGRPAYGFLRDLRGDKAASVAYTAILSDERYPGMYRLKRTDGTLSDMMNLTRAKDALAARGITHGGIPAKKPEATDEVT